MGWRYEIWLKYGSIRITFFEFYRFSADGSKGEDGVSVEHLLVCNFLLITLDPLVLIYQTKSPSSENDK